MEIRYARGKLVAAAVAMIAAGALATGASPATASASSGYISGAGNFADDWNDEGTLSTNSYSSSNATCLWQRILESEGYTLDAGPDGHFGSETKAATRMLQVRWGLADSYASADGKVGPNTFKRAQKNVTATHIGSEEWRTLKYNGKVYSFQLFRNHSGKYQFTANGPTVSYTNNTCD